MKTISVSLYILYFNLAVTAGCPLGCKCVKEKNIASCTTAEFDTVPRGFPIYITEISLVDNKIQTLGPKAFQRQLALIKVDLSENQISDISSDAFVGASGKKRQYENKGEMVHSLVSLSLRSNKLMFIPTDALTNLRQLKKLVLADNKITLIESNAFFGLSNLRQLDLSKNAIEMATVDAFEGLQDLQILDLSANSMSVLSPSVLGHLASLKQLHLTRNSIRKIHPLAFSHFTVLQELFLAANRIQEIPDRLFASTAGSLLLLDLSKNEIKELSAVTFKGLKRLQSLKLSNNHLTTMHDHRTMSGVFRHLTSLKSLKLDSNRVECVPDSSLDDLEQLQELTLAGNLMKTFPNMNLPSLERLDLSSNLLSALNKSSLQNLPFLERLDLADNVIVDVTSDAFSSCHRLRSLHMERNRLTTPYVAWVTSQRFRRKRTHINACAGHLAGNPWLCDCRTWAFARALAKSRSATSESEKIYVNSDVMTCDQPDRFSGKTLTEFAEVDLNCDVIMQFPRQQLLWAAAAFVAICVVFVLMRALIEGLKRSHGRKCLTKPNSKHL